jgi:hypothetical protein
VNWPPAGGNWEGGATIDGRRWEHVPHVGWRPARRNPYLPGTIYRDPRIARRRSRLARWLGQHRHGVVTATVLTVVTGYATTVGLAFDQTVPTMRTAAVLAAVAVVLVGVLLAVVVWSRRD